MYVLSFEVHRGGDFLCASGREIEASFHEGMTMKTYLAAAAALSVADYLGEVSWQDAPEAKDWYMRMKSRPAFRPLRAETMRGVVPPEHYAALDF